MHWGLAGSASLQPGMSNRHTCQGDVAGMHMDLLLSVLMGGRLTMSGVCAEAHLLPANVRSLYSQQCSNNECQAGFQALLMAPWMELMRGLEFWP